MTLLGYDLFLLDALRRQVRRTAGALASVGSDDPLAVDAVRAAHDVQRLLELDWLPAIGAVLVDDPLGGPGDAAALATAMTTAMTTAIATAMTAATAWWESSTMGGDAAGPRLDDTAWAATFDEFARRRLDLGQLLVDDPDDTAARRALAALDAEIAAAAARYASAAPTDGHVRWFPTALLDASPMAAALVLRHLRLDDRTLAAVSALVMRRWREGSEHGMQWPDTFVGGDNTADLLFRILADRPAAAASFLERARPDEILLAAQFDDTVARLLIVGTSPAQVDEATAGRILRPLLEWLQLHGVPSAIDGATRSAPAIAAAAVTPWLADLGPRAARWDWTYDDGDRALRWLLDDPAARAAMADGLAAQRDDLSDVPMLEPDGRVDGELVRDLAGTFAQVQLALRDAEIAEADADGLLAQLAINTAGMAITAAAPSGPIGFGAEVGVALLAPVAIDALDRWGIAPSPEGARRRAQQTFGDRAIDTAVMAVTGIVGAAVERGELPPDTLDRLELEGLAGPTGAGCAPREVSDRLHAFVADLAPLTDPATHNALLAVLYAFANPLSDAQLCD
ncbi:MAG: hypothetical protein NTZ21_05440 [Actinobacteria bacterium]|nr:hypothetical protein [Actinomycetota bacterium]